MLVASRLMSDERDPKREDVRNTTSLFYSIFFSIVLIFYFSLRVCWDLSERSTRTNFYLFGDCTESVKEEMSWNSGEWSISLLLEIRSLYINVIFEPLTHLLRFCCLVESFLCCCRVTLFHFLAFPRFVSFTKKSLTSYVHHFLYMRK